MDAVILTVWLEIQTNRTIWTRDSQEEFFSKPYRFTVCILILDRLPGRILRLVLVEFQVSQGLVVCSKVSSQKQCLSRCPSV